MSTASDPLVSVGLTSFRRPEGLRKILECVLNQTYKNLDIMVSDNCSAMDEVEEVLSEFSNRDSRVRVFRQKSNIGVEPNHTFIARQSRGEYFLWLHDDDDVPDDFIECCLARYSDAPEIVLVGPGGDRYMDGRFWYRYANYSNLGTSVYERLRGLIFIIYSSPNAFEQYFFGLFKVAPLLDCLWTDGEFYFKGAASMFFRLAEQGYIHCAPEVTVKKYNEKSDIIKWHEAKYYDRPLRYKIAGAKVEKLLPRTLDIIATVLKSKRLSATEKARLVGLCLAQFAGAVASSKLPLSKRIARLPRRIARKLKHVAKRLLGMIR